MRAGRMSTFQGENRADARARTQAQERHCPRPSPTSPSMSAAGPGRSEGPARWMDQRQRRTGRQPVPRLVIVTMLTWERSVARGFL